MSRKAPTVEHRIVLERGYSHRVRIADSSAESVAKGLSLALQQCLADLETRPPRRRDQVMWLRPAMFR